MTWLTTTHLGINIDNRLSWKANTEAVYKKGMSRLRKRRSFNMCSKMLEIFYQSVVASVLYCSLFEGAASEPVRQTDCINSLGDQARGAWRSPDNEKSGARSPVNAFWAITPTLYVTYSNTSHLQIP